MYGPSNEFSRDHLQPDSTPNTFFSKDNGGLLPNTHGRPWQQESLRSRFWKLRTKVFGVGYGKTFHDFRGTTATELSYAGCTENEIAAVMGWAIGDDVPMS
jgi:integrase